MLRKFSHGCKANLVNLFCILSVVSARDDAENISNATRNTLQYDDVESFVADMSAHFFESSGITNASFRFVIQGSFAAHIQGRQYGLKMPYNDIDLYYGNSYDDEKKAAMSGENLEMKNNLIKSATYSTMKNVLVDVNFVEMRNFDFKKTIFEYSDINCVQTGVEIILDEKGAISRTTWAHTNNFEQFLNDPLHIIKLDMDMIMLRRPASEIHNSVLRALLKSQDLGFDVQLPPPEQIPAENAFTAKSYEKYLKLTPANKVKFDELFVGIRLDSNNDFKNTLDMQHEQAGVTGQQGSVGENDVHDLSDVHKYLRILQQVNSKNVAASYCTTSPTAQPTVQPTANPTATPTKTKLLFTACLRRVSHVCAHLG